MQEMMDWINSQQVRKQKNIIKSFKISKDQEKQLVKLAKSLNVYEGDLIRYAINKMLFEVQNERG